MSRSKYLYTCRFCAAYPIQNIYFQEHMWAGLPLIRCISNSMLLISVQFIRQNLTLTIVLLQNPPVQHLFSKLLKPALTNSRSYNRYGLRALPERRFPTAEQYSSVGGADCQLKNTGADWSKTGQEPHSEWCARIQGADVGCARHRSAELQPVAQFLKSSKTHVQVCVCVCY